MQPPNAVQSKVLPIAMSLHLWVILMRIWRPTTPTSWIVNGRSWTSWQPMETAEHGPSLQTAPALLEDGQHHLVFNLWKIVMQSKCDVCCRDRRLFTNVAIREPETYSITWPRLLCCPMGPTRSVCLDARRCLYNTMDLVHSNPLLTQIQRRWKMH